MRISDWSSDVCSSDLQDLGVVLFERTHRGVELTAAGTTFVENARLLLHVSEISRVRSRAASRGEIGELRVAYFGTVVLHTLPLLLRQLLSVAPSANVSLTQMNKNRQLERSEERRVGKACDMTFRHRWSPYTTKTTPNNT